MAAVIPSRQNIDSDREKKANKDDHLKELYKANVLYVEEIKFMHKLLAEKQQKSSLVEDEALEAKNQCINLQQENRNLIGEKEKLAEDKQHESDKLEAFVESSQEEIAAFEEANTQLKEEVFQHKLAIEQLMNEKAELEQRLEAAPNSADYEELLQTVGLSKKALLIAVEWVLRCGDSLQHNGYLNDENDKEVIGMYMSLYNGLNEKTEQDIIIDASNIPAIPAENLLMSKVSQIDASTSTVSTTSVDSSTSTVSTTHVDSSTSPLSSKELDKMDRDASKEESCFVRHRFLYNNKEVAPLPSTPVRQHDPPAGEDISLENPPKPNACHSRLLQQRPTLSTSDESDKGAVVRLLSVNSAPEIESKLPLLPDMLEQTIKWTVDGKDFNFVHHTKRYNCSCKVVRRDQSPDEPDTPNKKPDPRPGSSRVVPSSTKRKLSPSVSSVKKFRLSDTDTSSSDRQSNPQESEPASQSLDHEEESDGNSSDVLIISNEASGSSGTSGQQSAIAPHLVRKALENLELISDAETSKEFTSKLHQALINAVSNNEIDSALKHTIEFLSARIVDSSDYCIGAKADELLSVEQLAIVNAYIMINSSVINHLLLATIVSKVLESDAAALSSSASLCRVFGFLIGRCTYKEELRNFCCSLCLQKPAFAPYLIANILMIFPDVWKAFPTSGSGVYPLMTIKYLLLSRPEELSEHLWAQASNVLLHHLDSSIVSSPDTIVELTIKHITDNCSADMFCDDDVKHYVLTFKLLASRLDPTWVFSNLIQQKLFSMIQITSGVLRKKSCSAIALAFQMLYVLAQPTFDNLLTLNVVKRSLQKIMNQRTKVPLYVLKEAHLAQYNLHLRCYQTIDKESMNWMDSHCIDVQVDYEAGQRPLIH